MKSDASKYDEREATTNDDFIDVLNSPNVQPKGARLIGRFGDGNFPISFKYIDWLLRIEILSKNLISSRND